MGRLLPQTTGLCGVALTALALGLCVAAKHPLAPWAAMLFVCGTAAWTAWRPSSAGGVLAGLLPVASFAPWTGWWLVDEFDLVMLAVLAGAYVRWGWDARDPMRTPGTQSVQHTSSRLWVISLWVLAGSGLMSLAVGLRDAGVRWDSVVAGWASGDGWLQAVHADYASAFNPWRVSKSLLWALMIYPVLQRGDAPQQRCMQRETIIGLACGLALVCMLVVWERWLYVGVANFSDSYRTVAHFWEMHVGGGAIDAYLAMTVPVALWAVWMAPGGWRWWCAVVLALASTYAVLTTYSRGVYIAVAVSVAFMAAIAWRLRIAPSLVPRWRRWATGIAALMLVAETLWVLVGHSYMSGRMGRSEADLMDRVAHWQDGLGLLRTPADWLLGLGAGRLPAHYSERVEGGEFPGQAHWERDGAGVAGVVVRGPATRIDMAYDFGLTQRITPTSSQGYRVRYRQESAQAVRLLFSLCERHLLYDVRCQWTKVNTEVATESITWNEVPLSGWAFEHDTLAHSMRTALFAVTVLGEGQHARLLEVQLLDAQGRELLRNADFSAGLERWLPVAQAFFRPWHMDNLYLEVLVERGVFGCIALALLAATVMRQLMQGLRNREPAAVALAGAFVSVAILGLVISVTEIPRISFLLLLILLTTSQLHPLREHSRS